MCFAETFREESWGITEAGKNISKEEPFLKSESYQTTLIKMPIFGHHIQCHIGVTKQAGDKNNYTHDDNFLDKIPIQLCRQSIFQLSCFLLVSLLPPMIIMIINIINIIMVITVIIINIITKVITIIMVIIMGKWRE